VTSCSCSVSKTTTSCWLLGQRYCCLIVTIYSTITGVYYYYGRVTACFIFRSVRDENNLSYSSRDNNKSVFFLNRKRYLFIIRTTR